jgi:hypothetical protein
MQRDDSVMLLNKFFTFFPEDLATYVIFAWQKNFTIQELVCKYNFRVRHMITSGVIGVVIVINILMLSISGSVPPYYREIFNIISPSSSNVSKELFTKLLVKSGLPSQTLSSVSPQEVF